MIRAVMTLLSFFALFSSGCAPGMTPQLDDASIGAFDPAVSDPPIFDRAYPPVIEEVAFTSDGASMNAIVYRAQGAGPHPTVILLHGFPGDERNLDLAQAIRRAGWNVVFFHYRGAWGSRGQFSFVHVIEDVAAVVEAISQPSFAGVHRIDSDRIALVGHSMGGFAALISGSELSRVDCVVSIAGANLGLLAGRLDQMPEQSATFAATLDGWSGPINGPGGAALIAELVANAERFNTMNHLISLARKDLLLIAGGLDVVTPATLHHTPLVEALAAADARSLDTELFVEGDHAFSGQRIALAKRLTGWLKTSCAQAD